MERLKYVIEDKTIADLLGDQNFNNPESAILELVKNSYDAGATDLSMTFSEDLIVIKDNGKGMSANEIKKNWMHVGKSDKGYEFLDINKKKRISSGSKGVGRFALAKLGEEIKLYSLVEGKPCIEWFTDWNESVLNNSSHLSMHGTEIFIYKLKQEWNDVSIDELCKFLERTYNDTLMKITVYFNNKPIKINRLFDNIKVGVNYLDRITLNYTDDKLTVKITSDEFKEEVQSLIDKRILDENIDIHYAEIPLDILKEIQVDTQVDKKIKAKNEIELKKLLKELGPFNAEFYFNMGFINSDDYDKFFYKYKELPDKLESGVILYRNAFSISSFDGTKDWLDIGKRFRKSPAAASHKTGAWRVRDNQISGYVNIDKDKNSYIKDLSNRQGVEDNIYYRLLKNIIQIGFKHFEKYRQKIIRAITADIKEIETKKDKYLNVFIKKPEIALKLSKEQLLELAEEVKQIKDNQNILKKTTKEVENKYKYDIRILNALSTIGLRASSMAHEMENDKDTIATNVDRIIKELKENDMWEILNDYDHTKFSDKNVPKLLFRNREVNKKIFAFINTLLTQTQKDQFLFKNINLKNVIQEIKEYWETDYLWLKINIICPNVERFLTIDILRVIFDNLILNSIQQNENSNELNVNITIKEHNDTLLFSYKDDGVGLNSIYAKDPWRILEVHESTRENGHGLGMWIVNNTIKMTNGNIIKIYSENGFGIDFYLGDIKL